MAAAGVDYCGPVKTSHKGFFSYVRKVDERLARRVVSCFEEYSKISWCASVDFVTLFRSTGNLHAYDVKKVDERLAGRVVSCFEEYSKISW